MLRFSGVLSAMVTPFSGEQNEVDEGLLRLLTDSTVESGVHGLVPCGSTGEFAAMTNEERRRVVEIVLDQAGGRVPVIPHVGAMTTRETILLAQHAESVGAAAVMAVAPYYEPLAVDEVKNYYRDLASSISVPVIIYNLPLATGVNLLPADVAELATSHKNIQYVKDTTGDFSQAACLIHDYKDVITVFVGQDTFFLGALLEGATGVIVGAANFLGRELVAIWNSVQAGDYSLATKNWEEIFGVMQFLVRGGYVAGIRGALDVLGVSAGPARQPIGPLSTDRYQELEGLFKLLKRN